MLTLQRRRDASLASLSPHGFHRVVYYEWGDPANDASWSACTGCRATAATSTCWARRSRDTHRVLAVDMPGRGRASGSPDPNDYVFPTYLTTLTALIARSGAERVTWVGTSMGALLGMVMAAQRDTPVTRLVVNDAGPLVEPAALARIRDYLGLAPTFATFAEIDAYIRAISAPFGALTDAQWDHLTRTSVRAATPTAATR